MKKIKRLLMVAFSVLCIVCAAAAFAACGGDSSYKLTLNAGANGTVTASPASDDGEYASGTSITVTVTPNSGYEVDTFTVSGDSDASLSANGTYTFKIEADTTIGATFKASPIFTADYIGTWRIYGVYSGGYAAEVTATGLTINGTAIDVTKTADGYTFDVDYGEDTTATCNASLVANGLVLHVVAEVPAESADEEPYVEHIYLVKDGVQLPDVKLGASYYNTKWVWEGEYLYEVGALTVDGSGTVTYRSGEPETVVILSLDATAGTGLALVGHTLYTFTATADSITLSTDGEDDAVFTKTVIEAEEASLPTELAGTWQGWLNTYDEEGKLEVAADGTAKWNGEAVTTYEEDSYYFFAYGGNTYWIELYDYSAIPFVSVSDDYGTEYSLYPLAEGVDAEAIPFGTYTSLTGKTIVIAADKITINGTEFTQFITNGYNYTTLGTFYQLNVEYGRDYILKVSDAEGVDHVYLRGEISHPETLNEELVGNWNVTTHNDFGQATSAGTLVLKADGTATWGDHKILILSAEESYGGYYLLEMVIDDSIVTGSFTLYEMEFQGIVGQAFYYFEKDLSDALFDETFLGEWDDLGEDEQVPVIDITANKLTLDGEKVDVTGNAKDGFVFTHTDPDTEWELTYTLTLSDDGYVLIVVVENEANEYHTVYYYMSYEHNPEFYVIDESYWGTEWSEGAMGGLSIDEYGEITWNSYGPLSVRFVTVSKDGKSGTLAAGAGYYYFTLGDDDTIVLTEVMNSENVHHFVKEAEVPLSIPQELRGTWNALTMDGTTIVIGETSVTVDGETPDSIFYDSEMHTIYLTLADGSEPSIVLMTDGNAICYVANYTPAFFVQEGFEGPQTPVSMPADYVGTWTATHGDDAYTLTVDAQGGVTIGDDQFMLLTLEEGYGTAIWGEYWCTVELGEDFIKFDVYFGDTYNFTQGGDVDPVGSTLLPEALRGNTYTCTTAGEANFVVAADGTVSWDGHVVTILSIEDYSNDYGISIDGQIDVDGDTYSFSCHSVAELHLDNFSIDSHYVFVLPAEFDDSYLGDYHTLTGKTLKVETNKLTVGDEVFTSFYGTAEDGYTTMGGDTTYIVAASEYAIGVLSVTPVIEGTPGTPYAYVTEDVVGVESLDEAYVGDWTVTDVTEDEVDAGTLVLAADGTATWDGHEVLVLLTFDQTDEGMTTYMVLMIIDDYMIDSFFFFTDCYIAEYVDVGDSTYTFTKVVAEPETIPADLQGYFTASKLTYDIILDVEEDVIHFTLNGDKTDVTDFTYQEFCEDDLPGIVFTVNEVEYKFYGTPDYPDYGPYFQIKFPSADGVNVLIDATPSEKPVITSDEFIGNFTGTGDDETEFTLVVDAFSVKLNGETATDVSESNFMGTPAIFFTTTAYGTCFLEYAADGTYTLYTNSMYGTSATMTKN